MINDYRNPNFPIFRRFATILGAQAELDGGEMEAGFGYDDVVPGKMLNYLFARHESAELLNLQRNLGDFSLVESPVSQVLVSPSASQYMMGIAKYNMKGDYSTPNHRYWVGTLADSSTGQSKFVYSYDGRNWFAGASMGSGFAGSPSWMPYQNCLVTLDNYVMCVSGQGSIRLFFIENARTGTASSVEVASSGTATCINVGRVDTRVMIGDNTGKVHMSLYGHTGSWGVRTLEAGISITSICQFSDIGWLALSASGKVYITTNDGFTWSEAADLAAVGEPLEGRESFFSLEVGASGRAVVVASSGSSGAYALAVAYSDDYLNWDMASVNVSNGYVGLSGDPAHAVSLGGSCWAIAGGELFTSSSNPSPGILISADDGETWVAGNMTSNEFDTTVDAVTSIGFDGNTVIAAGTFSMLLGKNNGELR